MMNRKYLDVLPHAVKTECALMREYNIPTNYEKNILTF